MTSAATAPSIFIAMPVLESVKPQTMKSIVELTHAARDAGIPTTLRMVVGCSLIDIARNELVAQFLRTDCTHLLFVDADLEFQPALLGKLLAADVDIVGVSAAIKRIDWALVRERIAQHPDMALHELAAVHNSIETGRRIEIKKGALSVPFVGTGIMLIRRHVLERLTDAHPELRYHTPNGSGPGAGPATAIFATGVVDGQMVGEDGMFCRRARAMGFGVHALFDAPTYHYGTHGFFANLATRYHDHNPPPDDMLASLQRIAAMANP